MYIFLVCVIDALNLRRSVTRRRKVAVCVITAVLTSVNAFDTVAVWVIEAARVNVNALRV
jgi:hypothetical protein